MIRIVQWKHYESTFLTTRKIWLMVEEDGQVYTGIVHLDGELTGEEE